jgi:hypothetical protein
MDLSLIYFDLGARFQKVVRANFPSQNFWRNTRDIILFPPVLKEDEICIVYIIIFTKELLVADIKRVKNV